MGGWGREARGAAAYVADIMSAPASALLTCYPGHPCPGCAPSSVAPLVRFNSPSITICEYKNPLLVERGFLYSWWRRGELNPCPKTIERQDYMRSLRFIVANGAPEDRLGRPPSTFPASRVHLIPAPVDLAGTIRHCIPSFAAQPESPALDAHGLLSRESVIEVFGDCNRLTLLRGRNPRHALCDRRIPVETGTPPVSSSFIIISHP